jgi:hypothetical protein
VFQADSPSQSHARENLQKFWIKALEGTQETTEAGFRIGRNDHHDGTLSARGIIKQTTSLHSRLAMPDRGGMLTRKIEKL